MPSFQHFQGQADHRSSPAKLANEGLSLSVVLRFAETAKKQSFESFCRIQPLVKSYRDKVDETSKAIAQAGSQLEGEVEVPAGYAAHLALVQESFAQHLGALDGWMRALTEKDEPQSAQAMLQAQQSGQQLEAALQRLSAKE